MKKNIFILLLLILALTLASCDNSNTNNHETEFQTIKELRINANSYYRKSTQYNYVSDGSTQTYTQELFVEGNIEYQIVSNGSKRYFEYNNTNKYYIYEYNINDGKWYRYSHVFDSSSGDVDFWDINNYDYIDGSFYLKSQFCVDDQISYKITILSNSSYEFRDEYTLRSFGLTARRVDISTTSRFNETFNLKLPSNYIIMD